MRKLGRSVLFAMLFCVAMPCLIYGFEVELKFNMADLGFADTRKSTATDYPLIFPWGFSLVGSQAISDELSVTASFYSDPVLNYISYTLLTYRQDLFSVGVGPFFGFFNSENSVLKAGISTGVRVDIPGLVFVSFRADSSIGGRLVQEGDYLQERSDVSIGYYVQNAICSVNLLTKGYTQVVGTKEIVDTFTEYSFKTDIHQKNVPYRIELTFGYQRRAKSYVDRVTRDAVDHVLNSIIVGTQMAFDFSDFFSLRLDVDSSIYSFGSADDVLLQLPTEGIGIYLFDASIGVSLNLDPLSAG